MNEPEASALQARLPPGGAFPRNRFPTNQYTSRTPAPVVARKVIVSWPSLLARSEYTTPLSGKVICGGAAATTAAPCASHLGSNGGGVRRGSPACWNSLSMSEPHISYTTRCTGSAVYGGHARNPVRSSIRTVWWRVLTRIGDLPGMNQVGAVCGQSALGRSPEAAHTSTVVRFAGKLRTGSASDGSWASMASTTWKKSGAATCTPTNAGLLSPSKFPTHTARMYGPKIPTVHASRKPQDVPVFQYTGSGPGIAADSSPGRGLSFSMSRVT